MMKSIRYSTVLLLLTTTVCIFGCTEKLEEASILCADLDTIKDPAQKERLTKECPGYISGRKVPVELKTIKATTESVERKPLKVETPESKKQKHSKWFKPSPVVNW
jgi:hypothetical protein